MKVCVIAADLEVFEQCRRAIQELSSERWEVVQTALQQDAPEADVYIWDYSPESFFAGVGSEIIKRSLFVVDPKLVDRFREQLGTSRASILLKPVQPAALLPFLE